MKTLKLLIVPLLILSCEKVFGGVYEQNARCIAIVEKHGLIPSSVNLIPLKSGEVMTVLPVADTGLAIWRGLESPENPGMYPSFEIAPSGCSKSGQTSGYAANYIQTGLTQYVQKKNVDRKVVSEIHDICKEAPAFQSAVSKVFQFNSWAPGIDKQGGK